MHTTPVPHDSVLTQTQKVRIRKTGYINRIIPFPFAAVYLKQENNAASDRV